MKHNQTTQLGHLGKDPEIRNLADGKCVAHFSLANDNGMKGEKRKTNWHNITCFDRLAQLVAEYCKKGDLVLVTGSISYSEFTGKDGIKRNKTEIIARDVDFVVTKGKGADPTPSDNSFDDDDEPPF